MESYDFDPNTQKIFNHIYGHIPSADWRNWLNISSSKEYEEFCLKHAELSGIDDIFYKLKNIKTESRDFSISVSDFLEVSSSSELPIFCHSSGTTSSKKSSLKWFQMSKDFVQRNWAPGMQAIFQSSGLDSKASAIVFVPSRIEFDGINYESGNKYVKMYTSEFSQRLMLSIIKPKSYLLYEYRNSKNLEIISKILTLDSVNVISAPAATVLGWINLDKFKSGIKASLNTKPAEITPMYEELVSLIKKDGLTTATKKIQNLLFKKLKNACLVFSISSLSEDDWSYLREYMDWQKGDEKFTNLYVASEAGPIAASLHTGDFKLAQERKMVLFPLYLAVLKQEDQKELISRSEAKRGELCISRLESNKPLINLELGDVINVLSNKGLPQIEGIILRSSFKLKYPIRISEELQYSQKHDVLVGGYFKFNNLEIIDPKKIKNCLSSYLESTLDSLLLVKSVKNSSSQWELFLKQSSKKDGVKLSKLNRIISDCSNELTIEKALKEGYLEIRTTNESPVSYLYPRSVMLKKVQDGELPKGILKKWPLYVLIPNQ
jgi:hypothetical protein